MADLKEVIFFPSLPGTLLSHWPSLRFLDVLKSSQPPHFPEYFPWPVFQWAGTRCGNFEGVNTQPETQLHLPASYSVPSHSFTDVPTAAAKSALSFLTALKKDMMDHRCSLLSPSGASTELIPHPFA